MRKSKSATPALVHSIMSSRSIGYEESETVSEGLSLSGSSDLPEVQTRTAQEGCE